MTKYIPDWMIIVLSLALFWTVVIKIFDLLIKHW